MALAPCETAIVVRLLVLTDHDGTCTRHDALDVREFFYLP